MPGDYNKYRMLYSDKSVSADILTTTDYTTATALVTPKSANHAIVVQRIYVSPTVYAAKTWTFQDSTGTPVKNAFISIPAAAPTTGADGEYWFDFGPTGYQLPTGKNLALLMSATGAAAAVHIECFEKLVGPVAAATTN